MVLHRMAMTWLLDDPTLILLERNFNLSWHVAYVVIAMMNLLKSNHGRKNLCLFIVTPLKHYIFLLSLSKLWHKLMHKVSEWELS